MSKRIRDAHTAIADAERAITRKYPSIEEERDRLRAELRRVSGNYDHVENLLLRFKKTVEDALEALK